MKTRRSFIKRLSAGSFFAAAGLTSARASEKNKSISNILIHHVFFWLKNPQDKEERKQFEDAIHNLMKVETIRDGHFGVPAPTEDREVVDHSYTYSLMLIFNSKEDQDTYQAHPIHQEFVEKNQHLWKKVKVMRYGQEFSPERSKKHSLYDVPIKEKTDIYTYYMLIISTLSLIILASLSVISFLLEYSF